MKRFLERMNLEIASPLAGKFGDLFRVGLKSPIFVVGTGRSGTTLFYKILKSHPDIIGFPGEANSLWHPMLEPFEGAQIESPPIEIDPKRFTELSLKNWPGDQARKIYETFNGFHLIAGKRKTLFVKSAMISFMIPRILEIFPDARIVHIYRNGPSVIESYYNKNFGNYLKYVYTVQEYYQYCARYWSDCILEIDRAKTELSLADEGAYFEFSYEDLCENPEGILKELSSFIGVEFEKFTFNLSRIQSQNYKVKIEDEKWGQLLDIIRPVMELKGYIS